MKKVSLDASLKSVIRDAVDQRLAEVEAMKEEGEESEGFVESAKDNKLDSVLAAFPASEGYYGKIYKKLPDGSLELKDYVIENLESVPDPEVELKNIAKLKNWGPGTYALHVRNYKKRGLYKNIWVKIAEPTNVEKEEAKKQRAELGIEPSPPPPPSIVNQVKEMAETVIDRSMNMAKQMTPNIDLTQLGKTISEVLLAGINAGKSSTPPPVPPSDGKNTVVEVITVLKDAGLLTPPKPVDETSIVEKTIKSLKELGVFDRKPDTSIFEQIKVLRDLGLIPQPKADDMESSIEKLKTILELVTTMIPAFQGGEKASPLTEAIRIIGPHIPKIAENVTKTVNNVTEVSKMRLMQRMGTQIPPSVQGSAGQRQQLPLGTESRTESEAQSQGQTMHPAFAQILNAVRTNNFEYFPKLQEWITLFAGPHVIDSIRGGAISSDTIFDYISPYVASENPETVKTYISSFVSWVKSQRQTPAPVEENAVSGKCVKCGAIYDYESKESFTDNEICDCGGKIELIS